jgi:cystathionine beta-synthase
MIERAEAEGLIKPGDTLVEPSSGNTGIGLAMAAAVKGYKMVITMPEKMSEEKRRLIRAYGAELILTPTELPHDHPDNYIGIAKRMAEEDENTHLLNQYINEGNPLAHYEHSGPEVWEQTDGKVDYIVCGMGTGGSITGISKFLKEKNPDIQIIGTDPVGSLFTGEVGQYLVEGIGYDFYPDVFEPEVVDTMYRIGDEESFNEVRELARQEGILAGGSTGNVIAGVRRLLESLKQENKLKGKTIVMFVHDSGRSYLSKVYNDDWMQEKFGDQTQETESKAA